MLFRGVRILRYVMYRSGKCAFTAAVMAGFVVAGICSASAQSVVTLPSASNSGSGITVSGGNVAGGSSSVEENTGYPPGYNFDIYGVTATRSGNNLTVTIYTNYANNVGTENTGLGYLFFGTTSATQYAASINYNGSGGPNTGSVYQPGSKIENSFYGNTSHSNGSSPGNGNFTEPTNGVYGGGSHGVPCNSSPCNGGYFNPGHPVGVTTGASLLNAVYGVTETWSVTSGTEVHSHNQSSSNFSSDGEITFTLDNVFDPSGLDLGGPNGTFDIAWSMTCANDYIVDTFVLPPSNTNLTTPLPAALPLFASGTAFLGLLRWRRKRKSNELAAAA
jgi:hypothetical protein